MCFCIKKSHSTIFWLHKIVIQRGNCIILCYLGRILCKINRDLPQDVTQFKERSLVLRHVSDQRISLRRKRNALVAYHDIIPRILIPNYVRQAIVLSI